MSDGLGEVTGGIQYPDSNADFELINVSLVIIKLNSFAEKTTMSTPGSYTLENQIHSLSLLSNVAFGVPFLSSGALQTYVTTAVNACLQDTTIQSCIGSDWQLIWGPCVHSNNPNSVTVVADNVMMLLYSQSQNAYVIAIAGTNIDSMYGWFQEDFQVNTVVDWTTVVPDAKIPYIDRILTPAISAGTNNGLQILLGMEDTTHDNNTMLTELGNWLSQATTTSNATIAVAGHSLGGALSPVLALYMHDIVSSINWNSDNKIDTIHAWPTAGPTPGNEGFALYYGYVAGNTTSSLQLQYTSKYNPLDVIPQAWQTSTLVNIPGFYSSNIPTDTTLGSLVLGAFINKLNSTTHLPISYTQVQPWTSINGSAFDIETDTKMTNRFIGLGDLLSTVDASALSTYQPDLTNLVRFLAQMGYQHTTAYTTMLGLSVFSDQMKQIIKPLEPSDLSSIDIHLDALGKAVGVALTAIEPAAGAQNP